MEDSTTRPAHWVPVMAIAPKDGARDRSTGALEPAWMPTDVPKSIPSASSLEKRGPTKSHTYCREFVVAPIEIEPRPTVGIRSDEGVVSCLRAPGICGISVFGRAWLSAEVTRCQL
jgi:hypothetical protein